MEKLISFVLKNKRMVLYISSIVVLLMVIIIVTSQFKKNDNDVITEPTTVSYSTTTPAAAATNTIPPIGVNTTAAAETENTATADPEATSTGGLEVNVQGGTELASAPINSGNSSTVNNSSGNTSTTKQVTKPATTTTTKKPSAPTASAVKPTTSVSIVTNSPKPSVTKTPTPTPTATATTISNKDYERVNEIINVAVNVMSLWDTIDYRTIGEAWKKDVLYYYAAFTTSSIPAQLDKIISDAKKYNIVSIAEFVPDSITNVQKVKADYIIRGTFYIKYSSLTNADYLKQIGFKADTWYSKRSDVYVSWAGSQMVWEHGDYTAEKQVDLTNWKETKR